MSNKDDKSERRSSEVTMDKLEYQAKVMLGKADERRDPPEIYNGKNPVSKKPEEKISMPAATKKTVSDKLRWSDGATFALMKAIVENQEDYNAFIKATVGTLKSEAGESDKYIYESKLFEEKHILSKARSIITKMKADDYVVSMPKQNGGTNYEDMYAKLGELGIKMPPKDKKKKK
jgi:hypothetical protein